MLLTLSATALDTWMLILQNFSEAHYAHTQRLSIMLMTLIHLPGVQTIPANCCRYIGFEKYIVSTTLSVLVLPDATKVSSSAFMNMFWDIEQFYVPKTVSVKPNAFLAFRLAWSENPAYFHKAFARYCKRKE